MSSTKNQQTQSSITDNIVAEFDSDVLFQKIFDKWYAFSVVDGECMMTQVPESQLAGFSAKAKK